MPAARTVALVAALLLGTATTAQSQARTSVNLADREAVLGAWLDEYNRTEPNPEWTGDVSNCNGGTTSTAYQQSVLQRVNWFRRMAGLNDVAYRADLNGKQQAGAVVSSANNALNHTPDPSWKCWTQPGYDANSTSNLALGMHGVEAVDAYIHDWGDNNRPVGHRWWLFHPGLRTITSGDIPESLGVRAANAIHVFDVDWSVSSSRDGFVAWPPPGHVPYHVVYPRWSVMTFSSGAQSDFTNATITVTGPNGPLSVIYDHRSSDRIVFVPAGFEKAPVKVSADLKYTVNVTGVAGPRSSFSYDVVVIPSNHPPRVMKLATLGSDKCAKKGSFMARVDFNDRESDVPTTVTLVDGDGATDNARFIVAQTTTSTMNWLSPLVDLDGSKREFNVRLRITDSRGASTEGAHTFTLADTANGRCSVTSATSGTTGRTDRRDVTVTMRPSTRAILRSFTSLPPGTLNYASVGNCSLTPNKRAVIAGLKPGLCTITITGRSSSLTSIVVVYVRVQ